MPQSPFRKHSSDIESYLRSEAGVFRTNVLRKIFESHREQWEIDPTVTSEDFLSYLARRRDFKKTIFDFPGRKETLYHWISTPKLIVINALKPAAYFSHYTAMYLHHLTDQNPKTIYLNSEQSPKPTSNSVMTNESIKLAFSRKQRITNMRARFDGMTVCLLSGKNTNNAGVTKIPLQEHYSVSVTNLERTLIDIVVRPVYAGGITEIVTAYRNAASRVAINGMLALLKRLGHSYPYHQAIGLYMEKAGNYTKQQLKLIESIEQVYDFYLVHGISNLEYSDRWRVFYPKGM